MKPTTVPKEGRRLEECSPEGKLVLQLVVARDLEDTDELHVVPLARAVAVLELDGADVAEPLLVDDPLHGSHEGLERRLRDGVHDRDPDLVPVALHALELVERRERDAIPGEIHGAFVDRLGLPSHKALLLLVNTETRLSPHR